MKKKPLRYSLVFHYFEGGTKTFTLKFADGEVKSKFTLTEIDVFTSNFSSGDELVCALNTVFPGFEDGYFNIEYNMDGSQKPLELVFNDMSFIRNLAKCNIRKSIVPKSEIISYMRWFLSEIDRDPGFLKFIFDKRYANIHFKHALSYYLILKNSDDKDAQSVLWQAEAKLCKEFCHYKTIRGIEIGRRNYKFFKQNKNIERRPSRLTTTERAKLEYELNHPKKKALKDDGQMTLFDVNVYSEGKVKKTRK